MDDGFRPSIRHGKRFDPWYLRGRAAKLFALAEQIAESGNHHVASKLLRVVAKLEGMAGVIDGPAEHGLPN